MYEYLINTSILGAVFGILAALVVGVISYDEGLPPQKTIGRTAIVIFGCTFFTVAIPALFLIIIVYLSVAFARNDWHWHRRYLRNRELR